MTTLEARFHRRLIDATGSRADALRRADSCLEMSTGLFHCEGLDIVRGGSGRLDRAFVEPLGDEVVPAGAGDGEARRRGSGEQTLVVHD